MKKSVLSSSSVTPKAAPKKSKNDKIDYFNIFFSTKGLSQFGREIFVSLWSRDRVARRMSVLFLLSLLGIGLVGVFSWQRIQKLRAHSRQRSQAELFAKNMGEFFGKQAEGAKRKYTVTELGTFLMELKLPSELRVGKGVVNMAEIDITVECDLKETCEFISNHLSMARDQVASIFTALDREEVMSREGKKRMKKLLLERLNLWLPKGKVENLFFTRLIMS